jgi:hypothetical protein
VLAVVEDDQQLGAAQPLGEDLPQWPVGIVADAQRRGDRVVEEAAVAERPHLDEPHAVGERPADLAGDPDRQPGLAGAADTGQRYQPRGREQPLDLGDLPLTIEEAAHLGR